ncbi:DUF1501 domain-containing protein [Blastopirellula marina]|uniref:DUF1501 domain-containing protein n=2 Tax=Blastopirellula marina TaxID=124 RepID=A0A2S8GBG7_9BACT|nr:DUF1501 domain-containing protein [Blastopirellula marina]PTL46220.1 DUF1501 domain-containing protein [Blastopirellula marina]
MLGSEGCGTASHFSRRTLLSAGAGLAWLTPLSRLLAASAEQKSSNGRPKSVIVLWMQGGPSQLETWDPHPNKKIGGDTKAIDTSVKGLKIANTMPLSAELMDQVSLLRCVTSKEGDHERATYNMQTGYRPDPTLIHPAIGAVLCHELSAEGVEIPRHVSIFPEAFSARGGFLGNQYDAFKMFDPSGPLPDLPKRVSDVRFEARLKDLDVLEASFARGRRSDLEARKTLHREMVNRATTMMTSQQIAAFNINDVPEETKQQFGDTPFGRGCLCATQLIETGVRCVQVTLGGWDTHANNHDLQSARAATLDAGLSATIKRLKEQDRFEDTIILCGGEFGRTPNINPAAGRDHWPHGFSVVLTGGGIRRGTVLGETDPDGTKITPETKGAVRVEDIHATIHSALGINFHKDYQTPIGRPMAISQGMPIKQILAEI